MTKKTSCTITKRYAIDYFVYYLLSTYYVSLFLDALVLITPFVLWLPWRVLGRGGVISLGLLFLGGLLFVGGGVEFWVLLLLVARAGGV